MLNYRRRLPHVQPDDSQLFLTWRLWGSFVKPREPAVCATPGRAFLEADRVLDQASQGPTWLKDPRVARLVAEAIRIGEQERHFYKLAAWVIMSNHVHLLISPTKPLPTITRWLKGSTAYQANKLLGRTGRPFWRDESFDHWVRSDQQLAGIAWYIENNPVKAGLCASPELWPWSSANGQAKPPAPL